MRVNIDKMINKLFISWIVITPFIVWRGMYEGVKVIWFLSGAFFLILHWIIGLLRKPNCLKLILSDLFYFAWLVVLLISSIYGIHPTESILGGSYRHQGVIFFLALWLVGKKIPTLSQKEKKLLIGGIAFGVIAESLIVMFQHLTSGLYFGRPLGTFGEPNAVAAFLSLGTYFVIEALKKRRLYLGIVTVVVSTFLTFSRTGFASLLLVLGNLAFKRRRKSSKLLVAILLLAIIGVVIVFKKASITRGTSIYENRTLFREIAIKYIREKPVFGWGMESQEYLYDKEFALREMPLEGMIVDRSHNLFLDIALWSGLMGLGLFIVWLLFIVLEIVKNNKYNKLPALSAFLIFSMFQPLGVVHWLMLFVIIYL